MMVEGTKRAGERGRRKRRGESLFKMARPKVAGLLFPVGVSMLDRASAAGVGLCDPARRDACATAFLNCKFSVPAADREGICACAAIFYGACLPTAGCAAADEMVSCVDELMELDCLDMSVCGNDCTLDDGDPLIPADSVLLPVNNFGANYLQLSVCSKDANAAKLSHFGQVIMERCSEDDFRVCDLAIAPRTLTAVAFPPDVTYLRVEQCVFSAAVSEGDDDGVGSEDEEEAEGSWECLTDPLPAEYYGVTVHHSSAANSGSSSAGSSSASASTSSSSSSWSHWPSSVDVDYSVAAFCEKDSHCPGSYCSSQQQPRICAPKLGEHFEESGAHFLDPRWEILA